MGVPQLYSWIGRSLGVRPRVDNDLSCDYLYVDMNSIIHPSCRKQSELSVVDGKVVKPALSEREMFANIIVELENLIYQAKPEKFLYIAIDGVAPGAKMSQQRGRRLRSIMEVEEATFIEDTFRDEQLKTGDFIPDFKIYSKSYWDSNVISPGTEFMMQLSLFLQEYIADRVGHAASTMEKMENPSEELKTALAQMNDEEKVEFEKEMELNKAWSQLNVIISDANVPGEGEHKVLDFIRALDPPESSFDQTKLCSFHPTPPSQKGSHFEHVIVGDDADLSMLCMAIHRPRVGILRNLTMFGKQVDALRKRSKYEPIPYSVSKDKESVQYGLYDVDELKRKCLQRVLYNKMDIEIARATGKFVEISMEDDVLKNYVNDIVLIFMLAGNDFLPHLPTFEIAQNDLDSVLATYQDVVASRIEDGFLTSLDGEIDRKRFSQYLSELSRVLELPPLKKGETENMPKRKMFASLSRCSLPIVQCHNRCKKLHGPGVPRSESLHALKTCVIRYALKHSEPYMPKGSPKLIGKGGNPNFRLEHGFQSGKVIRDGRFVVENLNNMEATHLVQLATDLGLDVRKRYMKNTDENKAKDRKGNVTLFFAPPAQIQGATKEVQTDWAHRCRNAFYLHYRKQLEDRIFFHDAFLNAEATEDNEKVFGPNRKRMDPTQYYTSKLELENDTKVVSDAVFNMTKEYFRGLQWTFRYYTQRNVCWKWDYPYHYAPFAMDIAKTIPKLESKDVDNWETNQPLKPIQQLLSVLPSNSKHAVPRVLAGLMDDEKLYPNTRDIRLDPNGKKLRYQWVTLINSLDHQKIYERVEQTRSKWSPVEQERDKTGLPIMFSRKQFPVSTMLEPKRHGLSGLLENPIQTGAHGPVNRFQFILTSNQQQRQYFAHSRQANLFARKVAGNVFRFIKR